MKRKLFFGLFFAGMILNALGAFSPIHEFYHWLFTLLCGGEASIIKWGLTWVDKVRLLPLLAGPVGELLTWIIVAFYFAGKPICAFAWGGVHSIAFMKLLGLDFNRTLPHLVGEVAQAGVMGIWIMFCVSTLLVGWAAIYPMTRKLATAQ